MTKGLSLKRTRRIGSIARSVVFVATSIGVMASFGPARGQDAPFPEFPDDFSVIFDSTESASDEDSDGTDDVFEVESEDAPLDAVESNDAERSEVSNEQQMENPVCDVLIDMRHAHDFSDFPLTLDDRYYHRIYSFNKAFQYLRSQGVAIEKFEEDAPLSAERLSRYKTLFLNLPSGDKEPFLLSELIAIRDFIAEGGSAFFIVDHTNCYFHQSRLKPLFHELDIEPQYYGVCDRSHSLGSGTGWVYFDRFSPSPVTRELRRIAFQTGGGVDPKDAVAWSSDESWQDAAGMPLYGEAALAYYGNFERDDNERVGSSGVVLAKVFGKGKIVVVGDQNLFSAFFLQYLDNYRLWTGAFSFLLDRPELAEPRRFIAQEKKNGKVILCWEGLEREVKRFGDPDQEGYYNIYTALCRRYSPFCIASDDSDDGLESRVFIAIGCDGFGQDCVDAIAEQLRRGRTAILLDPAVDVFLKEGSVPSRVLDLLQKEGVTDDLDREEARKAAEISVKKYCERISLSNGGRLILLRGKESFDNSSVPAPEARLSLLQSENIKALIGEIDDALDQTTEKDKKTEDK